MVVKLPKNSECKFAKVVAKLAHNEMFSTRRGVVFFENLGLVAYIDNNPSKSLPKLRSEILKEIRAFLHSHALKEVGFATYPKNGYTNVMLVEAEWDEARLFTETVPEIVFQVLNRMSPSNA